ncbi:MAG TPA: hypothetical protein VGS41_01270, partial [Chthonomonadales bacterium]|nr:hypothetical protein [Chthonomonadales bacterium]
MILRVVGRTPLLLRLLGISPAAARNIRLMRVVAATGWTLASILTLAILAAAWFSWTYYRDGTRPSWWVKGPLLLLRLLALTALVIMLSQPTLRLGHSQFVKPVVALLLDNSGSMGIIDSRLPARYARQEAKATGQSALSVRREPRIRRLNLMLNRARLLQLLQARYRVRIYQFASSTEGLSLTPRAGAGRKGSALQLGVDRERAGATEMGQAIGHALNDLSGEPIAGILVVSDGESNFGPDPVAAAGAARRLNAMLSAIGIGDPTRTKDVALLSLLADDVVRINNTVTVYAALSQRGYAGKRVVVSLLRNGAPFMRQTVILGPDDQKQQIHFTYTAAAAGKFTYTVAVAVQPGEITAQNNRRAYVQTVISKKLKVLYVEELPRYEYRYLRSAILRDSSLEFACLLLGGDDIDTGGEGNLKIHGFPQDEKSLFDYDIIILGDVPRSFFSESQLRSIRRFVEDRGASLCVIAGEQHMPQEYSGTPLEDVLPVEFNATPDPVLTEEPVQWQLTPDGQRSSILQLENDPVANARVWATLPGMFWAAGTVRARPGATVLAVHPTRRNADGPYPLVAMQQFGAGKCYMQLVDSTWRWRWRVGDRYFYRYWGQVLRALTPKDLPGNSRFVQLNADRSEYRLGERVALNARLLDLYYHPIKAGQVTAVVRAANGQSEQITLQATPGSPGLYTAQYQPERTGSYEVTLASPANPTARASARFVVESLALERQRPELNERLLKQVAAAGGGRYYAPDELGKWVASLKPGGLTVRSEQEIEVWDAPILLILLITPL